MKIEESNIVETNDYRVIIYPASRPFETKRSKGYHREIIRFPGYMGCARKPLSSSFKIEKNQFIIVCVDEEKEMASGCSIDALGKIMREIDEEYQLGLFDRMKASFIENGEIKTLKLSGFQK